MPFSWNQRRICVVPDSPHSFVCLYDIDLFIKKTGENRKSNRDESDTFWRWNFDKFSINTQPQRRSGVSTFCVLNAETINNSPPLPRSPTIRYIAAFNNSFPVTHCDAVLFYSTLKSLQAAPPARNEIIKLHLTFSNCNKHSDVVKLMDCLFLIAIAHELNFHTYISSKK